MGDHCSQCRYKPTLKTGPQACPFNALYWDFFARHESAFAANPRIGMVYVQLKRMPADELDALRQQAQHTIAQLESL